MLTGLTDRTPTKLQLDAGVLVSAYTKGSPISVNNIIGATRGGGSFSVVPTTHTIAVDGAPDNTKGLERVDGFVVTLNATMIEFNENTLKTAIGAGASVARQTNGDVKITADHTLRNTDYRDLYWIGSLSSGLNVVIKIVNAKNTGGLTVTYSDNGEGTFPLALVGNYDINALETAPFEIIVEHNKYTVASYSSKVITVSEAISATEANLIAGQYAVIGEGGASVMITAVTAGSAGSATITLADSLSPSPTSGDLIYV